jgi:hypothetical protein
MTFYSSLSYNNGSALYQKKGTFLVETIPDGLMKNFIVLLLLQALLLFDEGRF